MQLIYENVRIIEQVQVRVDPRPSDRSVRRCPLAPADIDRRPAIARRDRQTDGQTDGHQRDA